LGSSSAKKLNFDGSKQLLDGLARELRLSLTFIARQAEYQSSRPAGKLDAIEQSASDSLKLIDSYLLCAQSEYGQQLLPLEPVGPGSVLYEVAQNIYPRADTKGQVTIHAGHKEPVMANRKALVTALYSLAKVVASTSAGKKTASILLAVQKNRQGGLSMGVFAKGFNAKPSEIQRASQLLGGSDMALSNQTFASGVDLAIAGRLAASMGGELFAAKHQGRGGLCLSLLRSSQLSLVKQ
jgi:hypothetical protein